MPGLRAAAEGRIAAAFLQPQPDVTVPRFDYEAHLAAMTGPDPHWPDSTRAVSELRLSFRVAHGGMFGSLRGPKTVHLDIVDYPGEWLLDLALLDVSYANWAAETLARIEGRAAAQDYLALARATDGSARLDETVAKRLAAAFAEYLKAAREQGFSDCTPGRFLLPGDLAGSPALTFAPLPAGGVTVARQPAARDGAAVRGLQGTGGEAVLPRSLRADRPAGGAAGRAGCDPCRAARGRGHAARDGGNPVGVPAGAERVAVGHSGRAAGGTHPVRGDQGGPSAPRTAHAADGDHGGDDARREGPGGVFRCGDGGDVGGQPCARRSRRWSATTAGRFPACAGG